MPYETIQYSVQDGYAQLTLNRPKALNSFNEQMHGEVAEAVDAAIGDSRIRALLLTGAGRGFCAGQDLNDRNVAPDAPAVDLGHTLGTLYNPLVRKLRTMNKPVVCAVNGVAAGAGANLALACDIVMAARSARFIQAFCKIGLLPDSGGTWVLPRLVGSARASALALLGEPVNAEQAVAIGMIYKAIDDDALLGEARKLCAHFATQPTAGLAAIKRALLQSLDNSLDAQLDFERDTQRQLGRSADYREGVAAFVQKREPKFTGEL